MLYEFAVDEEKRARALVQLYLEAGKRLAEAAPLMEVSGANGIVRFRWVALGRRYVHPVYVLGVYNRERNILVLSNKPAYPAYLLALAGAFGLARLYTAVVARVGRQELRALLTPDPELAVKLATVALQTEPLVSPRRFLELDVSFEGYLYRVPVGHVAFEKPKPFQLVDVIEDHEEYEHWVPPLEAAKIMVEKIVEEAVSAG